jgi:single-strand DNA-binding protein
MDNAITLVGNLTADPELRYTSGGTPMANISIAVNRRYQVNNEWQEQTSFFRGTLWREQAENAAESLHKGDRVILNGRLEQRSWETPEGEKRSVIEVSIDEIGPSLRWASATVNKTARGGGGGGGWGDASMPAAPVARDDFGPDEAPF